MLAEMGLLQWSFLIALIGILGVSGLFVLYAAGRLFVNPARRPRR